MQMQNLLIVLSQGFWNYLLLLFFCMKMLFFRTNIHIHLQLFHITMAVHINSLILAFHMFG